MMKLFRGEELETLRRANLLGSFANCFGVRISQRTGVVRFRDVRAREAFDAAFARAKVVVR